MRILVKFILSGVIVIVMAVAVAASADTPSAGLDVARALLEEHKYTEASRAVDSFLQQHHGDAAALRLKADIYVAQGEWDHASDALEEALSRHEDDVELLLALSIVFREKIMRSGFLGKMSNSKKSRQALNKAFEIDPGHLMVRRDMVFYLVHAPGMAGGDKDRGERIATETVELDEAEGCFQLGVVYRKKKDLDRSVDQLQRALETDPSNTEALFILGHVYIDKNDYAASEETFKKLSDTAPNDPRGYDGLGDCYEEQKRIDEAITQYHVALEKDAWYGDSRFKLATLYRKQKDKERAAYQYEKLLELDPGHVKAGEAKKQLRKIKKGR
jgi:tetratricopeptide (TPR) repeat protein